MEVVKEVELREDIKELLKREAMRVSPIEACALLTGRIELGRAHDLRVHVAENTDKSTARFTIDPEFILQVITLAEVQGEELVAIFHSHIGQATPSALDLQFMGLYPMVWLIYSNTEDRFSGYQWDEGSARALVICRGNRYA